MFNDVVIDMILVFAIALMAIGATYAVRSARMRKAMSEHALRVARR